MGDVINPENPLMQQMSQEDLWRRFFVIMVAVHGKEVGRTGLGYPIKELEIGAKEVQVLTTLYAGTQATMTCRVVDAHSVKERYVFQVMDLAAAEKIARESGELPHKG